MKRRNFIQTTGASVAALSVGPTILSPKAAENGKLALDGGEAVCKAKRASWPKVVEEDGDVKAWLEVLKDKGWCRLNGDYVKNFEKKYAELMGTKDCIATSCGTTALYVSLNALEVGPGDEVLVPPYTFVATINAVLLQHAIPVYVDTDRESFQIDAQKLEDRITDRTKLILPVHLGGNPADMETVMKVAKKHNLPVLEDACQAHLAEWKGKKVGSIGDCGCFSFQVTKNLCSGEGGAIISDDIKLMDRCFSFHSNGRERVETYGFGYINNGINARMTEFQGALLMQGMKRVEEQSTIREENAAFLSQELEKVPGIYPAKMYEGTTRNAYHLYMFRFVGDEFDGRIDRDKFVKALRAEGVGCGTGYSPLNKQDFMKKTLYSDAFLRVYGKEYIDKYFEENECPENDKLCNEEAVWLYQTQMLASKKDMEYIAAAVQKVYNNREVLAKI